MASASCIAVMYHYVRDSGPDTPAIRGAVTSKEFTAQLDWLQERYRILRYEELSAILSGHPVKGPCAILTFDDGLVDHWRTVFPILRERGITGTFFLCPPTLKNSPRLLAVHAVHALITHMGSQEFAAAVTEDLLQRGWSGTKDSVDESGLYRYDSGDEARLKRLLNYELPYDVLDAMLETLVRRFLGDPADVAHRWYATPQEIREMSAGGMTFGGHTKAHRVLSRLTPAEQRSELTGALETIQDLTEQKIVPFAFPYGQPQTFTADTLTLLEELGYDGAFTTQRGEINPANTNRFALSRLDTKDLPPFSSETGKKV